MAGEVAGEQHLPGRVDGVGRHAGLVGRDRHLAGHRRVVRLVAALVADVDVVVADDELVVEEVAVHHLEGQLGVRADVDARRREVAVAHDEPHRHRPGTEHAGDASPDAPPDCVTATTPYAATASTNASAPTAAARRLPVSLMTRPPSDWRRARTASAVAPASSAPTIALTCHTGKPGDDGDGAGPPGRPMPTIRADGSTPAWVDTARS